MSKKNQVKKIASDAKCGIYHLRKKIYVPHFLTKKK